MSAEIIPFPKPPSYLDYCRSPRSRKNTRKIFKHLAEIMPEAEAERMTMDLLKVCKKAAARLRRRRELPPAS